MLYYISLDPSANSEPSLKDVASASTSYVLPVDVLSGMLAAHVQWANRTAEDEGKEIPTVVVYECHDSDFDTFGVVEKVLNRSYVDENAIFAAKDCLDYFGPFNRSDMLVDLSLESKAKAADVHANKKAKPNESSVAEDFDSGLIVCESEARMHAVANVATALGENHYVPFRMLFVEGVLEAQIEIDIETVEVPMMPAACLLGDHNNIFCLRKIVSRRSLEPTSFSDFHRKCNVFKRIPVLEGALSAVSPGDEIDDLFQKFEWNKCFFDLRDNGFGLGLRLGVQDSSDVKSTVLHSALGNDLYSMVGSKSKTVYLPGILNTAKEVDDNVSLFHRNENGEVVFTEKEAARASDFIASSGIEERVKLALQKKRFVLPQEVGGVNAHFCNELVYGKVNILWVCGVVRMESKRSEAEVEATGAATCQNFDVWPSEEAKANTAAAREIIQHNARSAWDRW